MIKTTLQKAVELADWQGELEYRFRIDNPSQFLDQLTKAQSEIL
jgi:hypothetical protein